MSLETENSHRRKTTDRRFTVRKTEPTIEPYERFATSKLNSSINGISESNSKTHENSVNSSMYKNDSTKVKPKSAKTAKHNATLNDKTQTYREKNAGSILTTEEVNLSQQGKQKSGELDRKSMAKTSKGRQSMQISGTKTLPNTNLLNKILKSKPLSTKDKATTQPQKQDDSKGSFWDFIYAYRKLNATTLSSVMTTSNKGSKSQNGPRRKDEGHKSIDEQYISTKLNLNRHLNTSRNSNADLDESTDSGLHSREVRSY